MATSGLRFRKTKLRPNSFLYKERMRVVILFPLMLASCNSGDTAVPAIDRRCVVLPGNKTAITSSKAGKRYFPKSFGKPAQVCNFKGYPECFATISEVERDWYPSHWDAAREPSLYERSRVSAPAGKSTLRFTWLPTFHHPVIVRIERSGEHATLIAKQLSGEGGYEPGKVEREVRRPLSAAEIGKLRAILFRTKVLEQRATECDNGLDGSQWIVEGVSHEGYRFINRWSPTEGPVRKFGDFALGLTGWTFEEIY
ncbi:hypothetical protein [Sphingopyxis sp. RIFCSPHIGHO2_12_FULL_65_19]|uniref:hypothetical protein n=1 Tax=Sphingopyxis sp. RIFCSPHIGHO2_12_FULL_65_19 TaxID=1802172 RepID=UPI0025D9C037|nr:hypothetical protein [Sphingopyxis sp. RIFCSPHIGHO2_12_FULL_65_19]